MNSHFLPRVEPSLWKGKAGGLLLAAHTWHTYTNQGKAVSPLLGI